MDEFDEMAGSDAEDKVKCDRVGVENDEAGPDDASMVVVKNPALISILNPVRFDAISREPEQDLMQTFLYLQKGQSQGRRNSARQLSWSCQDGLQWLQRMSKHRPSAKHP